MNTFDLRLDLDKSSAIQVVTLRQGDIDGTTIAATIYDHGALANLSGISSAYIEFALPDGTHYYRGSATVSGSVVTALVDESQAASVPGRACNAYFSLSDGTNEYSTASFVVQVLADATSEATPAESYDDAIQDFIDAWLDEHPEATTTVQDGAITTAKLADGAVTDAKLAQSFGILDYVDCYTKPEYINAGNDFDKWTTGLRLRYKYGGPNSNGDISYSAYASTGFISVKASTTYTLLSKSPHYHIYVHEYDESFAQVNRIPTASLWANPVSFTTQATTAYIIVDANTNANYSWGGSIKNIVTYLFEGDVNKPETYSVANVDSVRLTDEVPKFISGWTQSDGTIKLSNPEFSSYITLANKTNVYGGFLYGNGYTFFVNGTQYSNYCILPKSDNCIINIRKTSNSSDMSVKELDNMTIHIIHEVNERDDDVIVSLSSLSVTSNNVLSPISSCECGFIKTRNHNIAVDFGLADYQGRLGEYYRKNGIRYCDMLIFSHYHSDHIGAFAAAVSAGYLYIDGATAYLPSDVTTHAGNPEQEITAQRQTEIINILESHNCTIVQLTTDQELQLEDNVRLKFYNTDHTVYDSGEHMAMNYNDYSICFELFVNDSFVYNFTADLGPEGQEVMAGKLHKCNVLKSEHHGWDNGISNLKKGFILNVYPDAVVTANGTEHMPGNGQNSSMDSPYSPMQTWCEKYSVPHYATVLNGDISLLVTKSEWRFFEPLTAYVRDATWTEQMG